MESVKTNAKWYLLAALFLANILIWCAVFAEERNNILTVAFLDVGQGDAIFIEAPNGNQMLVDSGPNTKVLRELSKLMPFYDRSIDVVIATHPDADHIGGLIDVFERFDIGMFLEPGVEHDTNAYAALLRAVDKEASTRFLARRGMSIVLDNGVIIRILFPDRDVAGLDTNDASIVAQLVYGETEFLLTGDSPQKIEEYLTSLYGDELESDVLKVGHHGSKTSTSELFLGFASPRIAVISAGAQNRYGHPHEKVLSVLEQFDVETFITSKLGTIVFESDGKDVWVK
jgi:competence protein ComEC